jgi:hypothetical protein
VRGGGAGIVDAVENLFERLRGPVERVRDLVPFVNEREDLGFEVGQVSEVGRLEPLAVEGSRTIVRRGSSTSSGRA